MHKYARIFATASYRGIRLELSCYSVRSLAKFSVWTVRLCKGRFK